MPSLLSIPKLKLGFWETGVVSHDTLSILAPPKGSCRAQSWRLVTRESISDRHSLSGSTGQHPLVTKKEELHQFLTTWDCTAFHQRGRQTGPAESRKAGTLKCNVYADLGHTGHIGGDLDTVYRQSFHLLAPPAMTGENMKNESRSEPQKKSNCPGWKRSPRHRNHILLLAESRILICVQGQGTQLFVPCCHVVLRRGLCVNCHNSPCHCRRAMLRASWGIIACYLRTRAGRSHCLRKENEAAW